MNEQFIIDTIHERRHGIDMIANAGQSRAVYANPDPKPARGNVSAAGADDAASEDDPEIEWDLALPEVGVSDRDIAINDRPDLKPAEERMNIRSNRVQTVNQAAGSSHRVESDLEDGAMAILMTDSTIVRIQPQFGPVWFLKDGKWHHTFFDFCTDRWDGFRELISVRSLDSAQPEVDKMELIRNQDLWKYAHHVKVWTEVDISQPAVYRAGRILRARQNCNERNNMLVLEALKNAGGSATMGKVLLNAGGIPVSHGEDAVWSLIDRGLVVHDHPNAKSLTLKRQSRISIAGAAR